jgi:hypothetical protein
MPAPTFQLTQELQTCPDNGGAAIDETDLDRGNVEIDAGCCRTYGTFLNLNINSPSGVPVAKKLFLESSVATCTKTGNGAKTFSSDAFKLCGVVGKAFAGSQSGGGTVSGASFTSTSGIGHLSGALGTGAYTVALSGTLSSPTDGSFSGTLSGSIVGTFIGTIVSGVVTVTYTISSPAGATAVQTSSSFTVGGGGTTFTFAGSFSGLTANTAVNAYWKCVWTDCDQNGVVAQLLNDADDSVLGEYQNTKYSVKCGTKSILQRKFALCLPTHPCTGLLTVAGVRLLTPSPICFVPSLSQAKCLAGIGDKDVIVTIGTATGLGAPIAGQVWHSLGATTAKQFMTTGQTLSGSVSVNIVGIARNIFGLFTPARLQGTFTAGVTIENSANFRACEWISEGGFFKSILGGVVSDTGLQFGPGGLILIWRITGGTATVRDPNTGAAIPALNFPGTKTFGSGFPSEGRLIISSAYRWSSATLPNNCATVSYLKTDESVFMNIPLNTTESVLFQTPATPWLGEGTLNASDFMPDDALQSNGTGSSWL